jgi:hypothetical protein
MKRNATFLFEETKKAFPRESPDCSMATPGGFEPLTGGSGIRQVVWKPEKG